jgi:3-(methylthio)propionyl---CoA ligase
VPALSTGPTLRAYPLLFIVRKPGLAVEKDEILALLSERVAKWRVPDDVVFLDT